MVGGLQHLLDRHIRPPQIGLQDKSQFDLDPRGDEIRNGNVQHLARCAVVAHVVQQCAVIGLIDLTRLLHGTAGQSDLVPNGSMPIGILQLHPGSVDAVPILDGHARKTLGEMLDLHPGLFCPVEFLGECQDLGLR